MQKKTVEEQSKNTREIANLQIRKSIKLVLGQLVLIEKSLS